MDEGGDRKKGSEGREGEGEVYSNNFQIRAKTNFVQEQGRSLIIKIKLLRIIQTVSVSCPGTILLKLQIKI